ncbi:hypothetical protein SBP28_003721 [Candidozyma auris]
MPFFTCMGQVCMVKPFISCLDEPDSKLQEVLDQVHMSVFEVSKTVGELAAAITQKSKELDRLKKEYEVKLRVLDAYISKVVPLEMFLSKGEESDKEVTDVIDQELRCSNCSNIIYSLQEGCDYILVPRALAQQKAAQVDDLSAAISALSASDNNVTDSHTDPALSDNIAKAPTASSRQSKKQHGKQKRTCSYCNRSGHTRARCFERLSKEPGQASGQQSSHK